jgi:hypothetical protein
MQVVMPDRKPRFVPFMGGLDTTKQRLSVEPGHVQASMNYEPDIQGGYRRVGGFERFDGKARPSDAQYTYLGGGPFDAAAAIGVTVNGQTSGATGVVFSRGPTWLVLTMVAGDFISGENIRVTTTVVGVYSAAVGNVTAFEHNVLVAEAADIYRALILPPPGTGPSRVMCLGSDVFAIRTGLVYKATASGWTLVPLMREIAFTAGTAEYAEGSTLTKGGVNATVRRVLLASGSWTGGTAAGRMIVSNVTGGEFTAGASTGGGACTLSGASAAIALTASSSLDYVRAAFINNQQRIYACDGVNRPFEFDGVVLAPIDLPVATKPTCVESDEVTLYFGCGAEVIASSVGTPYSFSTITGAAQLGAGALVTDLLMLPGAQNSRAMFIGTSKGPKVLYGTDKDTWQMTGLGSESAVYAGTAQSIKGGLFFDASGARSTASTQSWGNFSYGKESTKVDGWLRGKSPVCSLMQANRTMYRVWFSDGTALSATIGKRSMQWMPIDLGIAVRQAVSHEIDGVSRTFVCDDSGWVYEMDVGRSFDGAAIEAWTMLHALNAGSVAMISTWRSGLLEASAPCAFRIRAQSEFDDGDPNVSLGDSVEAESGPVGMRWDTDRWDEGVWDGGGLASMNVGLRGVGSTAAVTFYSSSDNELPHLLSGLHLLVTPRRLKR